MKYFSTLLSVVTLSVLFVTARAFHYGTGSHGSQQLVASSGNQARAMNPHVMDVVDEEMAFVEEGNGGVNGNDAMDTDVDMEDVSDIDSDAYVSDMDTDVDMEDQPTVPVGEDQGGEVMYALGMVEEDAPMEEPEAQSGWAGLFGGVQRRQGRRAGRQGRRVGRRMGRHDRRSARRVGRHGVSPMYIDELDDVEQPQ